MGSRPNVFIHSDGRGMRIISTLRFTFRDFRNCLSFRVWLAVVCVFHFSVYTECDYCFKTFFAN